MRCGTKCFLVEIERSGKKELVEVIARTPAEARKRIRIEYGNETDILKFSEAKKQRRDL